MLPSITWRGRLPRRSFLAVPILSAFVTACGGGGDDSAPTSGRIITDAENAWIAYQRAPTYTPVKSEVLVPMSSGGALVCNLWRPGSDSGTPSLGKFPVLVIEFDPYVGIHPTEGRYAGRPLYYAERGYNVVRCDIRGVGRTFLNLGVPYTEIYTNTERQDNRDLIEWAGTQPWSDGQVAQDSGSYGGVTTMRVAGTRPPHLVTVVPEVIAPAYTQNGSGWTYQGGAARSFAPGWAAGLGAIAQPGADPTAVAQSFTQHPLYDDYWKDRDPFRTWDQIDIPVLTLVSPDDQVVPYGFENFVGLTKLGKKDQYLFAANIGHVYAPTNIMLLWFDHWLKKLPSAQLPTDRVIVQSQGAGTDYFAFDTWPPSNAQSLTLHLNAQNVLSSTPSAPSTATYSVVAGSNQATTYPAGQKLVFETAPLDQETILAGQPTINLVAALSATDTIFVANIYDVAPDGTQKSFNAVPPLLKASHSVSHESLTSITPNQSNTYKVLAYHTLYRFAKGHKIRVEIRGSDPALAEDSPAGTVTLATGSGGSSLDLPVIPVPAR